MADIRMEISERVKFDLVPKQVFIAFPAADNTLIRLLATGEKACVLSEVAVWNVQKRTDLMLNRNMKKLAKSLYNEKGIGYSRGFSMDGVPYSGDLRRYRHILDMCIKGSGEVPDYREKYADIMDAYDEEIDPILSKIRYAIVNECHRNEYKEAYLIADLTLANLMCNIAVAFYKLYSEKFRGNEYVLCSDPSDKKLHTADSLLSGYKTYPIRATDYIQWAKTLDDMVGVLAPKGLSLRKQQSIDYGIEGVLRRLQSKTFATKIAKSVGINTEWCDGEVEQEFTSKYVWWRYKM